jgi:hypothetical protein
MACHAELADLASITCCHQSVIYSKYLMKIGLVKTFDQLPRPHSIKSPFQCGYVPLIPDLRGEKDLTKKQDFRRMVSLTNRYLLDIPDLIP